MGSFSAEKQKLLRLLLKEKGVQAPRRESIPRRPPSGLPPALSFAQQRLWVLDRLEPGSAFYNVPVAVRLAGRLDVLALRAGLVEIVRRHEALRTTFGEVEGRPFQVISDQPDLEIAAIDLSGLPEQVRRDEVLRLAAVEAARPFDLERGPLVRTLLVRVGEEEHAALLTMHHIVSDGWSCGVLLREMAALYEAFSFGLPSPLPELPIQYSDFAAWQRAWLSGETLEEQLRWWREQLAGAPATLDLPTDHLRPPVLRYAGSRRNVSLPPALADRLRELARREDATLFMVLLAGFAAVLGRAAHQRDLVVGTPIANRNREEIEGLIGFFVNTLALRVDLGGEPGFRELLVRVRRTAHGAYSHQDLPFERIVEELHPEREAGRNPLFQVMFALQNTPVPRLDVPGLSLVPLPAETGTAKFDLSLFLSEVKGGISGDLEYSVELFEASTIDRLVGHLTRLLAAAVEDPEARVSELPLLSEAERQQLLVEWSDTETAPAPEVRLHELFEAQVKRTPDDVALIFGEERWTYQELDERAEEIAVRLREMGVGVEDRVGLRTSRTPWMVAGLLGILKADGAYVPLDPKYPEARLERIVADAVPVVVLEQREKPQGGVGIKPGVSTPGQLAYLVYTSGSTGEPKGVAITHASAVALVRWAWGVFPDADLARVLASTSISFDLSVFELFVPLSRGGAVVLAEDALALPRLPAAGEVTLINTVPSAMAELVRSGTVPPSVRTVNLAGEPLPRDLVEEIYRISTVERVFNLYGPSEDTTYSTWALIPRGARRAPSIGRPVAGTRVRLLDPAFQAVPVGVPGELCLGGAGLARGYLGRPALTAERWVPDVLPPEPGARLYRTGDLARFRPDGELEFLGRIDHQVKVRGFRIELGEIEAVLRSLPGVRDAAVLALGTGGDRRLAAYVAGEAEVAGMREAVRQRLPEYMIPTVWAVLEALPLTSNGKIDRKALARLQTETSREPEAWVAPRGPLEEVLAGIWSEVLDAERVGATDSFFELGGHSLLAMRALSRVRAALGVDLPLRALFEAPSVEEMARRIEEVRRQGIAEAPPLRPVPREGDLPLSFAQERMWFMDRLTPGSPIYNVPEVLRLRGPLRPDVLERCVQEMVARHESLRTRFGVSRDGRPIQIVEPEMAIPLPVIDLAELPEPARTREAERLAWTEVRRPFDLARGPVLRTHVLRLGPDDHVTVLSRHHIVSDGWSMELFSWEMSLLYQAFLEGRPSPLPPLPIQYADFSWWQREHLQGDILGPQLAWWRERLAGAPPLLQLPADRPRPSVQTYEGEIRTLTLPGEYVRDLRAFSRREGMTLFMTLLAAFKTLIHRYTGREDVLIGSPVANRHRAELETLIGFLANTLVLRTDLSGDPTFRELLGRVRETALGAYEHQDLPFERLVEELRPKRDLSYTPVFQVMFVQQGAPRDLPPDAPVLEEAPVGGVEALARFDLELYAIEGRRSMDLALEYNVALFDRARMDRMLGHLKTLLDGILADPRARLSELPLLTEPERHQLLMEWLETAPAPSGLEVHLHELFESQAARTPDAVAVIWGEERWTYRELDELAEGIAQWLREMGVGLEDRVGISARRTPWLVAGLLGILKAGAAYVPLDPEYPEARLERIVADAGVMVVLAETSPVQPSPNVETPRGASPQRRHPSSDHSLTAVPLKASGNDRCQPGRIEGDAPRGVSTLGGERWVVAYLIYTSGSTGEPKGVAIPHASAVALVRWAAEVFPPEDLAGVLASTSINFDLSVFELFVPLSRGGTVILAENALDLPRLPAAGEVRLINTVPSAMAELVRSGGVPASVRTVNLAGEPLSRELADRILALPQVERLFDLYGPSEDTTYSTFSLVPRGDQPPAIGRPVAGTRALVLDRGLRPVPIGVPGELFLGGAGLARGYFGRPDATAERWVPDPFAPAPGERLYRTGDLVRFRSDGELEFLGRIDHQVKVRGFRIEPGEIEAALRACPSVAEAVVAARGEAGAGDRRLVAWVAGPEPAALDSAELRRLLRERLPEPLVPSFFVILPDLPRTPTGKVDRAALPSPEPGEADAAWEPPRGPLEQLLAGIWADVLEVERVGAHDDFFDLGGHSLLATRLALRLRDALGVDLPVRTVFEAPTVAEQARRVAAGRLSMPVPRLRAGEGDAPLTFAQERMWFLDRLEPGAAYHIPAAVRLTGTLDIAALEEALAAIVRRHAVLRTAFLSVDGRPVQRTLDLPVPLARIDLMEEEELLRAAEAFAQAPFDLAQGPPVRLALLRLAADEHVLLVTFHHIVADGWSIGVLVHELAALYPALLRGEPSPLAPLPIQYADFARWQRDWMEGDGRSVLEAGITWWRERLGGDLPVLQLPVDRPRPATPTYRGEDLHHDLPPALIDGLRTLGRSLPGGRASLFMTALATFQVLLHRFGDQETVAVGTPVAGRDRTEVEPLIGLFVNTLVLRADVRERNPFRDFLAATRDGVLGAFAHQDVPFERLVDALQPRRSLQHTPLFQVLFALQNAPLPPFELPGLALAPVDVGTRSAQLDLNVSLQEAAGGVATTWRYATDLFDAPIIARMAESFRVLLEGAAADPDRPVGDLPLLAAAERQALLVEQNDTATIYPGDALVHELFEDQAARDPQRTALVCAGETMAYGELAERSGRLAASLRRLGAGPDVVVGLCFERSLDLMVGLFGILKAGAAWLPLDSGQPAERLAAMLEDSRAPLVVADPRLATRLPEGPRRVFLGEAMGEEPLWARSSGALLEGLAYVIYTSGSTGRPKGVMNTHGALRNRLLWMQEAYGLTAADRVLQKTPVGFDVSVWELLWPLMMGARLVLARPGGHQDPAYLARVIAEEGITTLHFVPSMLRVFLDGAGGEGPLRIITSGEALTVDLRERTLALGAELHNLYGPTEAAIDVTASACRPGDSLQTVPIGRPIANLEIHLVDRGLRPVPAGVAGELCIGGAGLARGYIGRPDLTAERFVPDPYSGRPGDRLYRTGDLARRLQAGELEYLGRLDHQVKIRGVRIEPGEIEEALARHPGVAQAVVAARGEGEGKRLAAWIVPRPGVDQPAIAALRTFLQERLPEPMVPSAWMLLDDLPRTVSGKVDRRALPEPDRMAPGAETVEPRNPLEQLLAEVWAGVLGTERVGVHDDFFELGGHSLLAAQCLSRVRDALGVDLPVRSLFEGPTIAEQARAVLARDRGSEAPIAQKPHDIEAPLSFAQERMWFLDRLAPAGSYHIPVAVRLLGRLDTGALEEALAAVVQRHEVLRTAFPEVDGRPVQQVLDRQVPLVRIDLATEAELPRVAEGFARAPFDLAQGPPVRSALLRLGPEEHVLLVTLHHIVADGWSIGVLVRELAAFYGGCSLLSLPIQYADYARWQREHLEPRLEDGISWWRERLGGGLPVLELPFDRPRPAAPSFRGGEIGVVLPAGLTRNLRRLGREQRASLFMTLLTGFQLLLHRLSGQDTVVVGTPVAGRDRTEIEGLIGLFVNTLALRSDLEEEAGFRGFLAGVRRRVLDVWSHQDVPFERLVEELQPQRDLGHTPLFQAMFALQNAPLPPLSLPGLRLEPVGTETGTAPFDLTVAVVEVGEELAASWVYARDLFDEPTVRRFARCFEALLEAAIESRGPVADLPLLAESERHAVLCEANDTDAPYPREAIHELFTDQARRTPGAVAVVCGGREMTYAELDSKSDELAERLRSLGVGPEVVVGLLAERSPDLIVAMLAVLKAGGAYLPLDPGSPRERLALVLEDAAAPVVLVDPRLEGELPETGPFRLSIRPPFPPLPGEGSAVGRGAGEGSAYVIYTSGSTGRPKGVVVSHQAVVRLVRETDYVRLTPEDVVAQVSNAAFDAATFEVWGPLLAGARIAILPRELTLAPRELAAAIRREGITTLFLTTALFQQVAREEPDAFAPVRHLLFGGEAIDPRGPRRVLEAGAPERLLHVYGPTESTTFATWHHITAVTEGARTVPIGRPIANTQAVVLDWRLGAVPLGAEGELCLGGDGLARGYLGRPDLTAERFVPDPWGDGGRLYRTGDRVRRLAEGEIEFLGRFDDQVKIRGFRIEPGEIEVVLAEHPGVAHAAVLVREEGPGERRLIAYVAGGAAPAELRDFLLRRLPAWMVPTAFVVMPELPLNPNGKVDRAALARIEPRSATPKATPRTPAEELLAAIWGDLLNVVDVGPEDGFFDLGGHSLLAARLAARVREAFGVELPLRAVFEEPTLREMAARIARSEAPAAPPIQRVGMVEPPLSFSQQRLWFLDRLHPGSAAYNIPFALRISGDLDTAALVRSLEEIQRRHEALRTTFGERDGEPVQMVGPEPLARVDLRMLPEAQARRWIEDDASQPFDLSHGPLLRAVLFELEEGNYILGLNLHHAIADGWSAGVLVRELAALYEGRPLPELPIQYGDYARWQRDWLQGDALAAEVAWWRQRLDGAPAALELPTDRPRREEGSGRGGTVFFALPEDLSASLRTLARREAATPFMLLLAGFGALLARHAGQDDLCVGTPIAGRNRLETEGLIGFFVNTLVLRLNLTGDPDLHSALRLVRETALDAFAHPDIPFEKLVEELDPERSLARSPIFQVTFALQNLPFEEIRLPGLTLAPLPVESGAAKYELGLAMMEEGDVFAGTLTYAADLFDRTTAQRLAEGFERLLADIAAGPDRRLSDLELLGEVERHQILRELNDTAALVPAANLHHLFEHQADLRPESVAVVFEGERWTYGDLERRANRIAWRLRRLGIGRGDRVAILAGRSAERIAWVLGVWKAGAAWVALDPEHPRVRLAQILDDAAPAVVLAEERFLDLLPPSATVLVPDALADEREDRPAPLAGPLDAAYVTYTSGSTGRPKGILAHHGGSVHYLSWVLETYGISASDVVLQLAPLTFDASVRDTFGPLAAGARLVVVQDEAARDPEALRDRMLGEGVTCILSVVPSLLRQLTGPVPSLRLILSSGEALHGEDAAAFGDSVRLVNQYGPSEATMTATWHVASGASPSLPVGRPIGGVRAHLLDRSFRPVPLGAAGEVCLGGPGLAWGYLGQPDRTAEVFVPDPFGEGRLYRTGDLGRRRADGTLELIGRIDAQVKIRGLRVEPGEAETVLRGHPGVLDAAVLAREERLVAYVVGEVAPEELRAYLAERLPSWLVPAAWVSLDALPLTPHGKVDRRSLPEPGRDREVVPPRDGLELELVRIWEEVLGAHPVGITDGFFDLGGHSLAAARLMAAIRKRLGRDLPLSILFRGGTVESLAALLREGGPDCPASPLVTLTPARPESSRPPLFCIHGAGGSVLAFAGLARALGEGQPFHALEARGLDRIEEMADLYLDAIRMVQPRGPYHLLGYSMGGKIAFELARRLKGKGEEIAFLGLMDIPALPDPSSLFSLPQPGEDLADIAGYLALYHANREASRRYVPGSYGGRVVLFSAEEGNGAGAVEPTLGWGELAAGGVEVVRVPGGHYTMLDAPCVESLAARLRPFLEGHSTA